MTMTFDRDTAEDARACVAEQVPKAFGDHALTVRRPWLWKCAQPTSWVYGFFVTVAPGAVILFGDLGEAIFRMNASDEAEALEWIMRCSKDTDYVMSKISPRASVRQFFAGDAAAFAKSTGNDDYVTDVKNQAEDGLSAESFYLISQEHEIYPPSCESWSASAWWFVAALQAFARLGPVADWR